MKKTKTYLLLNVSFLLMIVVVMLGNQHVSEDADQVQIMTVTGPVSASDMGTTLIHEHVLVDWIGADSTGYHRWDREEVVERVLPYFEEARERGVRTILECTPAYLGRDPYILQELSRRSGIQVLTNTGYYGAVENQFMPAHAREESTEDLAGRWITEYEEGIEGSGIRPGFMKISVKGEEPLSDLHQKIVRAAAQTHLETGLTIVSHTTGDEPALAQVELLERAGISPSAFVWTHAQTGTLETQIEIGKKGGWISLDNFNYNPDDGGNLEWFLGRITELDKAGLLHRVLISHDAGYFNPDEPNGGDFRSYTDLFEHLLPALLENGFTDDDIDRLLVQNPQEAYGIQRR